MIARQCLPPGSIDRVVAPVGLCLGVVGRTIACGCEFIPCGLVAISQRSRLCPCSPAVRKAPHGCAVHLPVPPTVMLRALAVASGPVHAQRELGKSKGIQARVDVYGANNWCPRSATFYQSTRTSAQAHVPMCTDIKKKKNSLIQPFRYRQITSSFKQRLAKKKSFITFLDQLRAM